MGQHDYVFPVAEIGGSLDPHSVEAVVRVTLYSEEKGEWEINRRSRMFEAEEGYPDYVEDTARAIVALETVVSGALAEEIVEDLAEEVAEDLEDGT